MLKRKRSDHQRAPGRGRGQKDEPTAQEAAARLKAIKELPYFIGSGARIFPFFNIFEIEMCLIINSMSYFNWQRVFLSLWYIASSYIF